MLYRLEIENFYSIHGRQVIDLRAAANAPPETDRLAPVWKGVHERAPKVIALFGPNASGKSNVLKALPFLAWFVKDSFSWPAGAKMPFQRFNDKQMLEKPTRLAIQLSGLEDFGRVGDPEAPQCRYAYELVIGGGSASHTVLNEALYYWPSWSARKVRLFRRNAEGKVTASKQFDLAGFHQALEKVLRPDASVISTLAQLKHPFSTSVSHSASVVVGNLQIERQEISEESILNYYVANHEFLEAINQEIERIDVGVKSMEINPNGPMAFFIHEGLTHPMPMLYESHGTRQFVRLFPFILFALRNGGIAVLDDLDSAIHPILMLEILRWFHDPKRNPRDAQLWMTCQNTSILEELSKEEVLFCEKDSRGRTEIYGLRDIQQVRRGDNYYRKYMGGIYGAIPQIG